VQFQLIGIGPYRLQHICRKTIAQTRIEFYRKAANIQIQQPKLLESDIAKNLHQARTDFKQLQKRHRELWGTHLEQLATAIVVNRSPTVNPDDLSAVYTDRISS
jgi:hypothetical protein